MTERIRNIISGWKNVLIMSPEIEAIAERRLTYCIECPFMGKTTCRKCGCNFKAKVRSRGDKCPIGKWGAE